MKAWILHATRGEGMVREVYRGQAIATWTLSEAQQWPSRAEAWAVAKGLNAQRGRTPVAPMLVEVDGPPRPHMVP